MIEGRKKEEVEGREERRKVRSNPTDDCGRRFEMTETNVVEVSHLVPGEG